MILERVKIHKFDHFFWRFWGSQGHHFWPIFDFILGPSWETSPSLNPIWDQGPSKRASKSGQKPWSPGSQKSMVPEAKTHGPEVKIGSQRSSPEAKIGSQKSPRGQIYGLEVKIDIKKGQNRLPKVSRRLKSVVWGPNPWVIRVVSTFLRSKSVVPEWKSQ